MTNVEHTPKLQAFQLLEDTVFFRGITQAVKLSGNVQGLGGPLRGLLQVDNSSINSDAYKSPNKWTFMLENKRGCYKRVCPCTQIE